ncbi:MAG: hypothetical protein AUJ71_02895 [Candidatus Omnitrophica bacterium CG1_02_49_16]|nr:MAG: hypothetical protein AUJ71_02895 [Candidatus Omnitrophica bacterium CG1_02_49_16]
MTPSPPSETSLQKTGYVYVLRNLKKGLHYLGWTTDLQRRFDAHNNGLNPSTKNKGPYELLGYETYSTIEEAKKREQVLKHNPKMFANFKKRALCASLPKCRKEGMG